jgi:hypothetical protein
VFLQCDENASVAVNKVRSRHSTTIHITLKRKEKKNSHFSPHKFQIDKPLTSLGHFLGNGVVCLRRLIGCVILLLLVLLILFFVVSFIHRGKAMGSYEMREG